MNFNQVLLFGAVLFVHSTFSAVLFLYSKWNYNVLYWLHVLFKTYNQALKLEITQCLYFA